VDVAAWLRGLELEQYEPAFRDNRIDAKVLPRLTGEDLKDIGVALRLAIAASSSMPSQRCAKAPRRRPLPKSPQRCRGRPHLLLQYRLSPSGAS
jgi:hypothetical protein